MTRTMKSAIDRRQLLLRSALATSAALFAPRMSFAAGAATDRRFVFVIQRGAADGLSTVVPYADPVYAKLRGALAVDVSKATKLDGTFALHPALAELAKMYQGGQLLAVHATASPYRERSHFDAQNVLETGGAAPYELKDGWLNRLVALLPADRGEAIALAPSVPMALRGAASVTSYAPSALPAANDDLLLRVGQLYEADAQLAPLWNAAMEARGLASDGQPGDKMGGGARQDPASLGRLAAKFLSEERGPRVAMLETGGWDTHSGQNARLTFQLRALDTLLASLRDGLGALWKDTLVVVATEFGRTAAANGTGGTDHGTASVALLAGGAVRGGRVLADWPGLANGALLEGRDLKPTTSLDDLIAAAAAELFTLDPQRTATRLFPAGRPAKRIEGIVRV
uniref:Putative exported protein n=1 Tax=uncultured bacterium BLR8 TaxID=506524 RepID=C0IN76_9BACT|nr:putative exported protein [uncultured bacterium BLR8]